MLVSRDAGFFSNVYSVIGALSWSEETGTPICLKFDTGPYVDASAPADWWGNYFEWTDTLTRSSAIVADRDNEAEFAVECALRLLNDRHATHEIIAKHISIKPKITKTVDDFLKENAHDKYLIGIHIRGTDKHRESPPIPLETYIRNIRALVRGRSNDSWRVFVATDEDAILAEMVATFGQNTIFWPALRSKDKNALHNDGEFRKQHGYRLGREALLEALTLARCDVFLGCQSNLSLFVAAYDINLPWLNLEPSMKSLSTMFLIDQSRREAAILHYARKEYSVKRVHKRAIKAVKRTARSLAERVRLTFVS